MIDGKNIDFESIDSNQQEQVINSSFEDTSNLTYVMQENKIIEIDILEKAQHQIKELENVYLPKIMALQDSSLLILGGQSEYQYAEETTEILRTTHALKKDYMTQNWYLAPKNRMEH